MKKNGILNIFLSLFAILVWILVFRSIYSNSESEKTMTKISSEKMEKSFKHILPADTMIPFEKDPFNTLESINHRQRPVTQPLKSKVREDSIRFPYEINSIGKIQYNYGIMLLLMVNNEEFIVRKNDTIYDFTVQDISDSVLYVKFHKKIFKFKIP